MQTSTIQINPFTLINQIKRQVLRGNPPRDKMFMDSYTIEMLVFGAFDVVNELPGTGISMDAFKQANAEMRTFVMTFLQKLYGKKFLDNDFSFKYYQFQDAMTSPEKETLDYLLTLCPEDKKMTASVLLRGYYKFLKYSKRNIMSDADRKTEIHRVRSILNQLLYMHCNINDFFKLNN